MQKLQPMLFSTLKGYNTKKLIADLTAGLIVAIIALPLSIALALASGVSPEKGLYTAIVAGFVISFLGGSTVQIAGPTAAFATIVAGIVAQNGIPGLAAATIMAGILLVLMGVFRLGSLIKFIPAPITIGFTAGIAVTILIGQFKDFFGVTYLTGMAPVETIEKLEAFFHCIGSVNPWAVLVGAVCLLVQIIWPKVSKKIPGSLIAVLLGIAMVKLFKLPVHTIGDLYTISASLPQLTLPEMDLSLFAKMLPDAFTIAVLSAIESLLSCVVADNMTGTRHRSNMELIAQGAGNIASALFGGIPATGAIARTAANIKNGGRTPIAGMVHALVLLLILVVLMPYAALIPMPTIASVLFLVAYNMSHWRPFVKTVKTAPKSDTAILILTFVLTVVFDLVIAIEVGMLLALILFIKRMSAETAVTLLPDADPTVKIYEVSGPMFFGAADKLHAILPEEGDKFLLLRFGGVTALDATCLDALASLHARCDKLGAQLLLAHVRPQPQKAMVKSGFAEKLGKEHLFDRSAEAFDYIRTHYNCKKASV